MTTTNTRNLIQQTPEQLQAIAAELERQSKTKRDYIVPAKKITMLAAEGAPVKLAMEMPTAGHTLWDVRPIAHEQFAEKLGIPLVYYRRMLAERPELLAQNVNTWLADNGKNYLTRTIDGNVRALLGDTYRVLDGYDLFFQAFKVIRDVGATVLKADLTEERLYIRAIHPEFREIIQRQQEALGTGAHNFRPDNGGLGGDPDLVCPGVLVRNSDVGRGGLMVAPYLFRFTCSNGAYMENDLFQVHSGRRNGEGEYVSDETRELEDKAFWGRVGDLIKATFDREKFRTLVNTINGAAATELEAPVMAVEAVVKNYGLTDDDRQAILNELISTGSTVWDLVNAVTAQAHKAEGAGDVEAGFNYQRIGGELLSPKGRELVAVRR